MSGREDIAPVRKVATAPLWKYFYWLAFIGACFIASEMLRTAEAFRLLQTPWLDVFANYGLLGLATIAVSLVGGGLLAWLESVKVVRRSTTPSYLSWGIVFPLFFAVWLNYVRLGLAARGIGLAPWPPSYQLLELFLLGCLIFALCRQRLLPWIHQTTARLRPIVWLLIVACLSLTSYLFLEPMDKGQAAPVSPGGRDRPLPNVIVIVLDSLTTRDMSLFGYPLPTTPNLDQLTRTWAVYENAHSTATGTAGLMPTLLTGRYPYLDQRYRYGDLAREGGGWLNLSQVLRGMGYETTYISGLEGIHMPAEYHLHYGFDRIIAGQRRYSGQEGLSGTVWSGVAGYMAGEYLGVGVGLPGVLNLGDAPGTIGGVPEQMYAVAEDYFQEQSSRSVPRPFFAYIHMWRPHPPFLGDEFLGRFLSTDAGLTDPSSQRDYVFDPGSQWQQPAENKLRLRYDENILKADQEVGDLVATLKNLGLYEQALIVITADHGLTFAEGYSEYGGPLLTSAEHSIPLLVKYPQQTEGIRFRELVSNVDVLPTILDVVGVSYPADWVDGSSLLAAAQDPDRAVYVRLAMNSLSVEQNTFAILSADLKAVSRDGTLFLFDLTKVPDEQVDLNEVLDADVLKAALTLFSQRASAVRSGVPILHAPSLPSFLFSD
jgi:arylsulfatase A-like enzyme